MNITIVSILFVIENSYEIMSWAFLHFCVIILDFSEMFIFFVRKFQIYKKIKVLMMIFSVKNIDIFSCKELHFRSNMFEFTVILIILL